MITNDILVFGPYIGSFEQEVFTFRPYITWINRVLRPKRSYISTHFNRQFLYRDIIDEDCFLPIYKQFSRNEIDQDNYIHKNVSQKDFNYFIKKLKDDVCSIEGCLKKDIDLRNIKYVKTSVVYPIHNKEFLRIPIEKEDIPEELKNLLVFLPYGDEEKMKLVYKYLERLGFVVIGDMSSPLVDNNIIVRYANYFEKGFEYIIGALSYAKAVVCPLSYWTIICNQQQVPVLSWGNNPGLYSKGGVYHFDNPNARILPELDIKSSVSEFLGDLEKKQ